MSNQTKRAAGTGKQIGGGASRRTSGTHSATRRWRAEGGAAELEGKAQKEVAKGAERVKGAVQEVARAVKHEVGSLIGNRIAAAGKARSSKALRQKLNK